MHFRATLTAVVLCLFLGVFAGCSGKNEEEKNIEKAGNSIQKAYDSTANAIKETVEGVNNAVYD